MSTETQMTDDEKAIERANSVAEWLRKYWLPSHADYIDAVLEIAKRAIATPEPACVMCGGKPIETGTAGCKDCNQYAEDSLRPMESPEDWVTQDIAPSRPGIDQWRFIDGGNNAQWCERGRNSKWFAAQRGFCRKHDDIIDGHRYEVRCRRKDLPPKQMPIRLWVSKDIGDGGRYQVFAQTSPPENAWEYNEITIDPDGKTSVSSAMPEKGTEAVMSFQDSMTKYNAENLRQ